MTHATRLARIGAVLALASLLGACALPRSGPDVAEITAPSADLPFAVVPVNAAVAAATRQEPALGFAAELQAAAPANVDRIARGDVLTITVWENSDTGLLNAAGIGPTSMPDVRVDSAGFIAVPYVGRVRAAGRGIEALRADIARLLAERTLNPQVDVFPHVSEARQVSVQGVVGAPGLHVIRRASRHLLPMLAQAGGVTADPEVVRIRLRRGASTGAVWLQDLYDRPEMNVALRDGDALIAERDRRQFTALGAVGQTASIPFPVRELSVARALGHVGGLRDDTADPTGVFVFRRESLAVATRLGVAGLGAQVPRVAYVLDLTKPAGLFLASEFVMRDGDVLYVTTAPFTQFRKVLQSIAPIVGLAGAGRSLSGL
ncbi:MAG: polysaccharide biosynthesis/export family protein [Pseudomonadota bacterium]